MKRDRYIWLLVSVVLLWGCGKGEEVADSSTENLPAPATTGDTGETKTTDDNTAGENKADEDATDHGTPGDSTVSPLPSDGTTNPVVADGPLAAYATALSMITPEHFAVVKLDLEKIRNAPLTKKLPGDIDDMTKDFARSELPIPGEMIVDLESIWIAFSPGTGKFEDFMPREVATEPKEVIIDEGGFEEEFEEEERFKEGRFEAPEGEIVVARAVSRAPGDFEAASEEEFGAPGGDDFGAPGDEDFGVAPNEGEFGPPPGGGPPGGFPPPPVNISIYARFKSKEAFQNLIAGAPPVREAPQIQYGGSSYQKAEPMPMWFKLGEQDVFFSTEESCMKRVIDAKGAVADTPLTQRLKATQPDAHFLLCGSFAPIRAAVTEMIGAPGAGLPPQVTSAIDKLNALSLALDLEGPTMLNLNVDATDVAGAEMFRDLAQGLIAAGTQGLAAEKERAIDPSESELEMLQFAQNVLGEIGVQQDGTSFAVSLKRPANLEQIVDKVVTAATEAQKVAMRAINAKQIAIAALNFEVTNNTTSMGIEKDGKQLLSWRVRLLPYMEAGNLYEDFKLDEAWDSEHNKQFLDVVIPIYTTESATDAGTTTWKYLPAKAFDDIMFIDAGNGKAVPWTQPEEFTIDPADPLAALGEEPEGGYMTAFRDGRVQAMSADAIKAHFENKSAAAIPDGPPIDDGDATAPPVDPADTATDSEVPVTAEARVWTDDSGTRTVKATLVKVEGGKVTMKRVDTGNEVTLPINKLSAEDQQYLESLNQP